MVNAHGNRLLNPDHAVECLDGDAGFALLAYIHSREGWLYLAAVLDLFSPRAVGWAMADDLGHELALAALDVVIEGERPAPDLVHHSDRGVGPGFNRPSQRQPEPIAAPGQTPRPRLRARTLPGQRGEAAIAVEALNRTVRVAKPISVRVA